MPGGIRPPWICTLCTTIEIAPHLLQAVGLAMDVPAPEGPLPLKSFWKTKPQPPSRADRSPANKAAFPVTLRRGGTTLNWCFSSSHYYKLLAAAESSLRGRPGPTSRPKNDRMRVRWVRLPRRHHPRPSPSTQVQDLGRMRANTSRLLLERWQHTTTPKGEGPSSPECFSNQHAPPELANPTTSIPSGN